jgi:hypothetical protein
MSWEPDDITPEDWKLKVKVECSACHGTGEDWEGPPCIFCKGSGYKIEKLHPDNVEEFLERRESADFTCICGKKESILRPKEGQIPSGWLNWDGNMICNDCKYKVMFAALNGAAMKIQQIKEA